MKSIDIHVYYGRFNFVIPDKSIDDILGIMSSRNIEKAILMSSISILQDFREGNQVLFDAIEPHDNLFGYCYINGNYIEESAKEIDRYLSMAKCKGVKYHPEYSGKRPDSDDILPLFEKIAKQYKKPALIHSWPVGEHGNAMPYSHPSTIANLAAKLSELNIVMGHMGGPEWQETIEIAKPYENLYLDTGSSYTHFDKVKAAVDVLGAKRIMFGSGMTEGCVDMQFGVVLDSEITDEQKQEVLYKAAQRLFKL